jgi:hypothetical protein
MSHYVKPTGDLTGHITLDMRVSPEIGQALTLQINESVAHTQVFIEVPLPDQLIVTQRQFASLQPYTDRMKDTEDRMYAVPDPKGGRLPMCLMEVIIDEDIDTVAEVQEAIDEYRGIDIGDYDPNKHGESDEDNSSNSIILQ